MLFKCFHLFWYHEEGKYLRHQCPRTFYPLTWYPELVHAQLDTGEEADVQKDKWIQMFFLLFINAVLQLFHLYTGKVSMSTKDGIAEGRGIVGHSRAKIIFSTKLNITPQNWAQKCLHIESVQKEAVAEPRPSVRKQDNSLMTLLADGPIPNCAQLKLSPRKYQKRHRVRVCGF